MLSQNNRFYKSFRSSVNPKLFKVVYDNYKNFQFTFENIEYIYILPKTLPIYLEMLVLNGAYNIKIYGGI